MPHATVVILTRHGDSSNRTDRPKAAMGEYLSKVLSALSGGASASAADAKAMSAR